MGGSSETIVAMTVATFTGFTIGHDSVILHTATIGISVNFTSAV